MTTSELEELVKELRTKREKPEEKQEACFEYDKFGSGNWGMMCDNNDAGEELGLYHLHTGAAVTAERGGTRPGHVGWSDVDEDEEEHMTEEDDIELPVLFYFLPQRWISFL